VLLREQHYVEVQEADRERAQAIVDAVFAEAEEAAYRDAGAPPPSQAERDEEARWRAEQEERQRRSDRRFKRILQAFFLLILVGIVAGLVWRALG
jgi:hypothetical protein